MDRLGLLFMGREKMKGCGGAFSAQFNLSEPMVGSFNNASINREAKYAWHAMARYRPYEFLPNSWYDYQHIPEGEISQDSEIRLFRNNIRKVYRKLNSVIVE
ncbi:hypothetical protein LOAG_04361 [Loa loa]|uniref:Uncharacterized protein n=1 Tax=Loa loa TaxID=7209 RepID=A0A1S0U210_LOALO|nr:hypothetical protein LOAG_04361 [Loa loa]EFO24122.1 hypothetical protein LOAG_04361 [Loa loa]